MPEYLAPGVYIQEMPSASKAIQGASTSTAGMVGITERGPVGVPTLITSVGAFKRIFGGTLNPATYPNGRDALPLAVDGFFANGGSRCYLVRVTGAGAARAGIKLKNAVNNDDVGVFARSTGEWGNSVQITTSHASRFSASIIEHPIGGDVNKLNMLKLSSTFGLKPGTTLAIGPKEGVVGAVLPNNIVVLKDDIAADDINNFDDLAPARTSVDEAQAALDTAQDADAAADHTALEDALADAVAALAAASVKHTVNSVEFDLLIEKMVDGVAFATELFTGLSLNDISPNYAPRVIGSCDADGSNPSDTGDSEMVRLHTLVANVARPNAGIETLVSGSDGAIDDPSTFVGTKSDDPSERTGIQALANETGISLVAVPGQTDETVQKELLTHCERMVYRFAVLDAPRGSKLAEVRYHRGKFDSTRSAIYYPWLTIAAPFGPKGELHKVPPSGHMLGIYARTDNNRGVWKAPANEVVRNIRGYDITVNKGEQDILNPDHVNCLRDFSAERRGYRVWGARTLSSDPIWRYVPVRRTFLFIEQSLDAGLQWSVFEPNGKPLWDTVKQSITGFLDGIWRQGGLAGVTQEQAFFVNVGYGITMEQPDIDDGRLIVEIGIAPVNPAEFVIIRISQKTLEAAG